MLTGSTIPEWDTMLYLKDCASPQEYDQAIFRLQNQYIRTLTTEGGSEQVKYNMKPQTLLVDFDPQRMFRLQEQRAQIYNVNTDQAGNKKLQERIETELRHSPIVTIGAEGLQRVEASDIMDAVRSYSAERSVMDEATEIPIDYTLLADERMRSVILQLNPIDASKGIEIQAVTGEESELEIETHDTPKGGGATSTQVAPSAETDEGRLLGKQLATYYAQILFYAFLTDTPVSSLEDLIASIGQCADNKRIARNVGLQASILQIIQTESNPFVLRALDYKIANINTLMSDTSLTPSERVAVAMKKFGRLSSSEIVTPQAVALEMIDALDEGVITRDTRILDIASKQGEFTRALVSRFGMAVGRNVYALPTSTVSYEFTLKVYRLLGLDTDHVISDFTTYDILDKEKKDRIMQQLIDMNLDIVIGNPPYQESDGGAGASSKPIYQEFVYASNEVAKSHSVMIMPARWYTGGKGLDQFREDMLTDKHIKLLYDYQRPDEVFPNTNNRGGVCFVVRDSRFDNSKGQTTIVSNYGGGKTSMQHRSLKTKGLKIFIRHQESITILTKVTKHPDFSSIANHISSRKPFGIESNIVKSKYWHTGKQRQGYLACIGKGFSKGFVPSEMVKSNEEVLKAWKVLIPRANNIGTELKDDNLNSEVCPPMTVCTEAYLFIGVGLSMDEVQAKNATKYMRTKFVRYMHSLAKTSHDGTNKTYRFVPLQDFTSGSDIDWSQSVADIDRQLYKKYALTPDEIAFIEEKLRPMV